MSLFYVVWSPEGTTPPRKRHTSHASACKAAWNLAKANPGQTFFILGRKGKPAFVDPAAPEAQEADHGPTA